MKKTKIQFQSGFQLFIYSKLDNGFESKLKRIQRWFQLLHRNKFGLVVIVIPKQSEKDKAYQNWHQLAIEAGVRLVTVTISSLENRSPSYRYKVNQEIEKNLIRGNGIIIHDSNDIELVEWLLASKPDNDTSAKPRLRRFIKLPQKSTIKASFKILAVGLALTFVSHILRNQREDNNYQLLQVAANTIDSDLIELNRNSKSANEVNHLFERKPYLASIATFSKIGNRMNLETVSFSRSLATDLQLKNSDLEYWLNTIPELSEPSPELPVYRIVAYNKNYTVLLVSIWNDPGDRIQLLAISPEVLLKSYQSRSLHSFVLIDGRSGFYPIDLIIPISYLLPFLESNTGVGSTEIRTIHSIFDVSFYILPKTGLALFLIQDNTDTMIRLSRFNLNDILIFIVFVLPTGLLITRRFNLLTFFKNQSRLLLIVHSLVAILWCSSVVILALNIRVIKPKNEIQVGYVSRIMEHRNNDELTWSIVQPNQFLDESEWLRTDAKGEAIITIDDGATIELDPNSLISLPSSAQNFISVFQGSVLITAGNDDAMLVKLGNQLLNLTSGSMRIFIDRDTPKTAEIEAGESTIINSDNNSLILQSDELLLVQDQNSRKTRRRIRPIAPVDNQRLFILGDEVDVEFRWIGPDANTILEIYSGNSNRKSYTIKLGQEKRYIARLPVGNHYWQIKQDLNNELSPLRRLQIHRRDNPTLFLPRHDSTLYTITTKPSYVEFRWKADEHSSTYFMEIAKDRGFTDRVFFDTVQRNSISLPLDPGRYYWRILTKNIVPAAESESSISSFQLVYNKIEPKAISLDTATNTQSQDVENQIIKVEPVEPIGIVNMTNKKVLIFRWKGDPTIERTLMLKDDSGAFVLQSKVTGNVFTLTDLTALDEGMYRWSLESDNESMQAKFTVVGLAQN